MFSIKKVSFPEKTAVLPQRLHSSFDLNRLKKTKHNLIDIPDHNAMNGGRLHLKIKKLLRAAITLRRKYLQIKNLRN